MMNELFKYFVNLQSISEQSENWEYIAFEGVWINGQTTQIFEDFTKLLEQEQINLAAILQLDGREVTLHEFKDDVFEGVRWRISVNKTSRLIQNRRTFFYSINAFKKWAKSLDAFDSTNPLLSDEKIVVHVFGIQDELVANNYIICCSETTSNFPEDNGLPTFPLISANVHILTQDKFTIAPAKFFIHSGNCTDLTLPFFQLAAKSLAVCLVSEIVDKDSIILRGIRKIDMKLYSNLVRLTTENLMDLRNTIEWVYEDKTDLKLKLLLDRLTLDINYHNDFTTELIKLNTSSLDQAKERFSFITFERKDQYQKELRELLKDLKTISDLYSSKARGVLTNLLRDVLAGILLIGITVLSKIDDVNTAVSNPIVELVFKAFSIYFIVSIFYQILFDIIDVKKAKDEFVYWKKTSREYISEVDFQKHLRETIGGREQFTYFYYGFLAITYLAISYLTWNFIDYLKLIVVIPK